MLLSIAPRKIKKIRRDFLAFRIVNFWNALPNKVVEAPSVKAFERRLDKFWGRYNIKYNFEKCVAFEKQTADGTRSKKLIDETTENLETPAD